MGPVFLQQLVMHQRITPHSDPPFIPLSPNLVGLLGALGDVDDLEGCTGE